MATTTDESHTSPAQAPNQGNRRHPVPDAVYSLLLAIVLVLVAEFAARNELVSDLILPEPSDVWAALVDGFGSGLYWEHILSTMQATLLGFALASVVAVTVAGVLASISFLDRVLMPFIIALQTLPKIAVAPVIVLWLGFETLGKTFVVAIVCFFPILINTLQGLRIRDRDQYELFKSLGASPWQLFRMLRIPNALPYIFAGLHIGVVFSLIGAIVSEFVGSRSGLGYILLNAQAQFNVAGFFAVLLILMVLGLALHLIMKRIERKVTFWTQDVSVTSA